MSEELDGYQVVVLADVGHGVEEHGLDNMSRERAEELLRQWHRPTVLRRGTGLMLTRDGRDVVVRWKDVLDMRIQPQLEVIL